VPDKKLKPRLKRSKKRQRWPHDSPLKPQPRPNKRDWKLRRQKRRVSRPKRQHVANVRKLRLPRRLDLRPKPRLKRNVKRPKRRLESPLRQLPKPKRSASNTRRLRVSDKKHKPKLKKSVVRLMKQLL